VILLLRNGIFAWPNRAAVYALGLKPPIFEPVTWQWADRVFTATASRALALSDHPAPAATAAAPALARNTSALPPDECMRIALLSKAPLGGDSCDICARQWRTAK
jgi:hypothetical protein